MLDMPGEFATANISLAAEFTRAGRDDLICIAGQLSLNNRNARFKNTGLLCGNFRDRVAQNLSMIQANAGNHGDQWLANIGAVQTSAQTGFKNCDLDILFVKQHPSQQRCDFEERWNTIAHIHFRFLQHFAEPGDQTSELIRMRHMAGHSHAFFELLDMRRCEQTAADPRGLQNRIDHRRS